MKFFGKKFITVVIVLALAAFAAACVQAAHKKNKEGEMTDMANPVAVIETNKGNIELELFADKAPKTAQNFIDLAQKGFYDGVIFHRVIDDFMIQGGDPTGTGRGGPGYVIEDEFDDELTHNSAGILSMANAGPNTGGSQFFITLKKTPWLDGKHAVFGKVIRGMDTVRAIGKSETDFADRPLEKIVMKKVTIKNLPKETKEETKETKETKEEATEKES